MKRPSTGDAFTARPRTSPRRGALKPGLALQALLALCLAGVARADTEHTYGAWAILSLTGSLEESRRADGWRYSLDAQHRTFDIGSGSSQSLLRPAIGYRLANGVSLWAGYGYFNSRLRSGQRVDEHRPWQQIVVPIRSGGTAVSLRGRLEQRDVEVGSDLAWVLRTQLKVTHPLGTSGRWQAVGSVEPFLFLRDTDWGGGAGMQQFRVQLGINRKLTARVALEVGYLNQWIRRRDRDAANHLAIVNLKMNF